MQILAYLLARFSEPSSYAGLGAALALVGWNLPQPVLADIVQELAALCALLAFVLKERGLLRVILLVFAVTPALSGCGGMVAAGSAMGAAGGALAIADNVASAADSVIATACKEYGAGKSAANAVVATGIVPASAAAKVNSIESFGDAACAAPPAGDPLSTAIWFGTLVGQLGTLTANQSN
jgi:hypothetical protein